jgi:hypothetical protein
MSLYVPYYRPYNKHNTNIHAPGAIWTHDPSKRAAVDPRLRPHGHWDRRKCSSYRRYMSWIYSQKYLLSRKDVICSIFKVDCNYSMRCKFPTYTWYIIGQVFQIMDTLYKIT